MVAAFLLSFTDWSSFKRLVLYVKVHYKMIWKAQQTYFFQACLGHTPRSCLINYLTQIGHLINSIKLCLLCLFTGSYFLVKNSLIYWMKN